MTCVGDPRSGHETDRTPTPDAGRRPPGPGRTAPVLDRRRRAGRAGMRPGAGRGRAGGSRLAERTGRPRRGPGPGRGRPRAGAAAAASPTGWPRNAPALGVEVAVGVTTSTPRRSPPPGPTGGRWSWPPGPVLSPTGIPAAAGPAGRRRPDPAPRRDRPACRTARSWSTTRSADSVGVGVAEWLAAATDRPCHPGQPAIRSPGRCWPAPATWPTPTSASSAPGWPASCAPASRRVGGGRSHGVDVWTGEPFRLPAARPRRLRAPPRPTTTSTRRSATRPYPRAGDCVAPRTVHEAILEGRRAALALLGAAAGPRPAAGRDRSDVSGGGPYRQLFTPAAGRSVDRGQPDRVLRPPHQLRHRGRPAERAARRLLRGPGRRRRRADHHRGALHPPHRLAVREAHPRLPPRGHPRLPPHHRRRARPRGADPGPDQPQRRAGVEHVHPPAGVGAEPGARPAVPGGAQGGRSPRDRRDRRRLRPGRRALHARRVRRRRAAVLALVDRAGLPLAGHQPPHRRLRRGAWRTGPVCCWRSSAAVRDGHRARAPRSACGCAATS